MKSTQPERRRFWLNIVFVVTFVGMLLVMMTYLNTTEPNLRQQKLKALSQKMQTSATRTRYQWQVEGKPAAIMLIHYNANGQEVGRKPVQVGASGLPRVTDKQSYCERLWRVLTNTELQVEGFKIRAEYQTAGNDASQTSAVCRFGYSRGSAFYYVIDTGKVSFES
ncbi:hypothetical protein IT774_00740 [Salinimonas marina]|uniref:MSHA biogenesis protein MshF n=1 Tax=Salinimonas marina TaxID=2785918 RepID=A0A7S9HD15_9ALTE|nr:hypothetical protein [Salinimonas marina]QPG05841.1 hypothetical protein IT774_00740 [Salinimonas marina]